jgi:hypothetical protein
LLFALGGTLQAKPTLQDSRYFPETGFGIDHDVIWDYFQSRGGVDTFGYPVSDLFTYRGFEVQIFQRHVLQINGEQVRPLNLLDPDVMPIYTFGGLIFPNYDSSVAGKAPAPDTPNYGEAVRQHLEANVPDTWEETGQSVGFLSYFLSAAPAEASDAGNLRFLLALEVWGFPTSLPLPDPNNEKNFIYQRFQRGIMHYDATNNVTGGILLGDAFKNMIEAEQGPDLAITALVDWVDHSFEIIYLDPPTSGVDTILVDSATRFESATGQHLSLGAIRRCLTISARGQQNGNTFKAKQINMVSVPKAPVGQYIGSVNATFLNLRVNASLSTPRWGKLSQDTRLFLRGRCKDWLAVTTYSDQHGWVKAEYVDVPEAQLQMLPILPILGGSGIPPFQPTITITRDVRSINRSDQVIFIEPFAGYDSVAISDETIWRFSDGRSATLADIEPGQRIESTGDYDEEAPTAGGTIDASYVIIYATQE